MKCKNWLVIIKCMVVCFGVVYAQDVSDDEIVGCIQAWNENMQRGITRLNEEPQQVGVTPINGCLLLSESDWTLPGRNDNSISIMRFYKSKIWLGIRSIIDPDTLRYLNEVNDWMG